MPLAMFIRCPPPPVPVPVPVHYRKENRPRNQPEILSDKDFHETVALAGLRLSGVHNNSAIVSK